MEFMKKIKNKFSTAMIVLIAIMAFGFTGCNSEIINCELENCNWGNADPNIDYSLPQFFIEGIWVKNDSSEELSINNYAHFWKRFLATCPTCRPAIDPPMPVIIFDHFGSFSFKSYDGAIMEMSDGNQVIHSFSATVLNNILTVDGLIGTLPSLDDALIDVFKFNGTYTLLSRPPEGN